MNAAPALILALAIIGFASPAKACSGNTIELIKSIEKMPEPPRYWCGLEFNRFVEAVSNKDWQGALLAYQAYLAKIGKPRSETADATDTVKYLQARASGKSG